MELAISKIKKLDTADMTPREIAQTLGVSQSYTHKMLRWLGLPCIKNHRRTVSAQQVMLIGKLIDGGYSNREISDSQNVPYKTVDNIRYRINRDRKELRKTYDSDMAKIDEVIRKSKLKKPESSQRPEPPIEIGDVIDAVIQDERGVEPYAVKFIRKEGGQWPKWIFQFRSGSLYTLTRAQLDDVLKNQKPRKGWKK